MVRAGESSASVAANGCVSPAWWPPPGGCGAMPRSQRSPSTSSPRRLARWRPRCWNDACGPGRCRPEGCTGSAGWPVRSAISTAPAPVIGDAPDGRGASPARRRLRPDAGGVVMTAVSHLTDDRTLRRRHRRTRCRAGPGTASFLEGYEPQAAWEALAVGRHRGRSGRRVSDQGHARAGRVRRSLSVPAPGWLSASSVAPVTRPRWRRDHEAPGVLFTLGDPSFLDTSAPSGDRRDPQRHPLRAGRGVRTGSGPGRGRRGGGVGARPGDRLGRSRRRRCATDAGHPRWRSSAPPSTPPPGRSEAQLQQAIADRAPSSPNARRDRPVLRRWCSSSGTG